MTTLLPMICARVDGIAGLTAKGHARRQSINIPEACGRSPLVRAEVVQQSFSFGPFQHLYG
jgi:hypothetical protein